MNFSVEIWVCSTNFTLKVHSTSQQDAEAAMRVLYPKADSIYAYPA